MEMTSLNGHNIASDALLGHVLEFCCLSGCPWVRYARRHVDRGEMLKVLTTLMKVSKTTRENATDTVQIAALRLVCHDLQLMAGKLSPAEKMSHALNGFDVNMEVFSKAWKLEIPILEYLRRSSLQELSVDELCHIRSLIHGGWAHEITATRGDGQSESPNVWVTPALQT